jgi:methyltransferase
VAPRHYLLIVAVHAAWLISLWILGRDQPVNGVALAFYLVLQGVRFWVMWTLGARWTTRIIVLPEQPLVSAGPYRFLSHPNYAVVAGEIPYGQKIKTARKSGGYSNPGVASPRLVR